MSLVLHAIRHGRWQYGGWVPLHSNGGVERGGTRAHPYPMGDGRWEQLPSNEMRKRRLAVLERVSGHRLQSRLLFYNLRRSAAATPPEPLRDASTPAVTAWVPA
eukprot:scaffold153830_cov35-Tisochrysis_lutea.AAC.5